MDKLTEDSKWLLITKYLGNELDNSEKILFEQWKNADISHMEEVEKAKRIWMLSKDMSTDAFDCEKGWNKIQNRVVLNENADTFKITWKMPVIRIAALLLLFVGLSFFILYVLQGNKAVCVVTKDTKLSNPLVLSDGTQVYLNANSRFTYPTIFSSVRKVELIGEAYFRVSHDSKRPFIVKTNHSVVKDLGTSFFILDKQDSVRVIVESGRVELSSRKSAKKLLLEKGSMGICYVSSDDMVMKNVFDINELYWQSGKLVFRNENLKDVFHRLKTIFGKDFVFNPELFNNMHLTATYVHMDLDEILQAIEVSHNLRIQKQKDLYLISVK